MLRLSLAFAFALALTLTGCGPTTLKCDDICTVGSTTSVCPSGTACLDTSTANVKRCLPSSCSTCPIGMCSFDVAGESCSNVTCM